MKNNSKKINKKVVRYRTPSTFRANLKSKNHEIPTRNKKTA